MLATKHAGFDKTVESLIHQTTVWVCDRYHDGFGLAGMDDSPFQEVATLLGYPFEGVKTERRTSSLLATALCDLAAFIQKESLFSDVVNDLLASNIVFQYWQAGDTKGQFIIAGNDVIQYSNIEFMDNLSSGGREYAEHIRHEPCLFSVIEQTGSVAYLILALVLRDRCFPAIWPEIKA